MSYEKQTWENLPSEETPISAERLNHMEQGIYDAFEEAASKASKTIYDDAAINLGRAVSTTIGFYSVAEGYNTTASGSQSHAEGGGTTASGETSHAEGAYAAARGQCSHAEGISTEASGAYSHAEGSACIASYLAAHAEGSSTKASGANSHAEGSRTKAEGASSHAEGYGTIASAQAQHAEGKYNVEDTEGEYAHIVGGGSSDTKRKNIHTLDWSGNAVFAGNVTDGNGNSIAGLKEAIPDEEAVDIDFSNYFS